MPGESKAASSKSQIIAIVAIVVVAIAVMAAIVVFALGGPSKTATPSDGTTSPAGFEGAEASVQTQEERIVGHWSNKGTDGGLSTLLSGINIEADGTAHRFENGTQGADYKWEARSDGTYAFTDYYGLDSSETIATIDDNDRLHWGDRVFNRDDQGGNEVSGLSSESNPTSSSSSRSGSQAVADQDIVGKWYYDLDPTGTGGAGRPMYYALEVLADGTATLTYNGMSYAKYSWTASGNGFDFTKTGGDGSSGYADSAHAFIEGKTLQWDGHDSDAYTPFIRAE